MNDLGTILEAVAKVVREAGTGPLAFFALGLVALVYLTVKVFSDDHPRMKVVAFVLIFAMVCVAPFAAHVITNDSIANESADQITLPNKIESIDDLWADQPGDNRTDPPAYSPDPTPEPSNITVVEPSVVATENETVSYSETAPVP